jgi:hypothetical protein
LEDKRVAIRQVVKSSNKSNKITSFPGSSLGTHCSRGSASRPFPSNRGLRSAALAYEHNILFIPHGWNTAIGLAADLHLTAALPVAKYVEYLTPSPYLDELIIESFRLDADGYLRTPTKPGLGIELNRDAMKRFGK